MKKLAMLLKEKLSSKLTKNSTPLIGQSRHFYGEAFFREVLESEIKRSEISQKPFFLMLIDIKDIKKRIIVEKVGSSLFNSTRETDIKGWYNTNEILGVIFTEINEVNNKDNYETFFYTKVYNNLSYTLKKDDFEKVNITIYMLGKIYSSDCTVFDKCA